MSFPLSGVNFVDQLLTPTADCALYRRCISDGVLDGFSLSASGSSLSVSAGWLMCGGKELQLASNLTIPVTGAVSGYARLLATVDLSGTAHYDPDTGVNTFTQAFLELEYSASRDGFASLIQGDLAGSGTKYQMIVCVMSLGAAGITGIVSTCGMAHGRAYGVLLELPASWDVNGEQTVRVDGVTDDTNVILTYSFSDKAAFINAEIDAIAQGEGWVKFHAVTPPSSALNVQLLLQ